MMEYGRNNKPYTAVVVNCFSGLPSITTVEFTIRRYDSEFLTGEWLQIVKGGITGFESAEIKNLLEDDNSPFYSEWVACGGTYRRYHRLLVPLVEIKRYLNDIKYDTIR